MSKLNRKHSTELEGQDSAKISQEELRALSNKALNHPSSAKYGVGMLDRVLNSATTVPASQIRKYVDGIRKRNPEASPERIVEILSSQFKGVLQSTGGAVGATAAIPTIGTATALVLTAADLAAFFATATVYSLAVAEVHGIDTDDPERRKALVLGSVLGTSGAKTVSSLGDVPMARWGTALMTTMPKSTIKQVNKVLTSRFVKRKLATHSGLALGRIAPFGIGAVIGVAGGRALAQTVITQAQRAFGPAPATFVERVIEVPANTSALTSSISDE